MKQPQNGFALIAAIVLIVVLAAMAGFVATMVGGQSASQQLERTTYVVEAAAQTGLEWGKNRKLAGALSCPSPTYTLTSPSLSGINISVACGATNKISSTATFGVVSSPDFVERIATEP
jgi:type II secretory pathway pseudopilin PulG